MCHRGCMWASAPSPNLLRGVPPEPFSVCKYNLQVHNPLNLTWWLQVGQHPPTSSRTYCQHPSPPECASQVRSPVRCGLVVAGGPAPPPPTSSGAYRLNPNMCRGFMQTGECSYGDRCKFTHGPGDTRELRMSFSSAPGQRPPGPPMEGGDDPPGLMMPGSMGGMPMMVGATCLLLSTCLHGSR